MWNSSKNRPSLYNRKTKYLIKAAVGTTLLTTTSSMQMNDTDKAFTGRLPSNLAIIGVEPEVR